VAAVFRFLPNQAAPKREKEEKKQQPNFFSPADRFQSFSEFSEFF
jgi:hypothetical protein